MKLFLIHQEVNGDWDTYDSAVVIAKDAQDACTIHPSGHKGAVGDAVDPHSTWCSLNDVQVQLLGYAEVGFERGVVCASFNAG